MSPSFLLVVLPGLVIINPNVRFLHMICMRIDTEIVFKVNHLNVAQACLLYMANTTIEPSL